MLSRFKERELRFWDKDRAMILTGAVIALTAALLQFFGNPEGTGLCVACFLRDSAGAMGFHQADGGVVFRMELPSMVLGSFLAALFFGEFKARGGSAGGIRLVLGMFAGMGAMGFLGCTLGIFLRIGSGNVLALLALIGAAGGIFVGTQFIKKGFTLGKASEQRGGSALWIPMAALLVILALWMDLRVNDGYAPFQGWVGASARRAPLWISLIMGLLLGVIGQRSRFCTVAAIRDPLMVGSGYYLKGAGALIGVSLLANLMLGQWKPAIPLLGEGLLSMDRTPGVRDYLLSFSGSMLMGLAFTLSDGCAFRNLIKAGQGDGDSALFLLGMTAGTALWYNLGLAQKPACGALPVLNPGAGWVIGGGWIFTVLCGFYFSRKKEL